MQTSETPATFIVKVHKSYICWTAVDVEKGLLLKLGSSLLHARFYAENTIRACCKATTEVIAFVPTTF
jgi:hypothetical protein